MNTQTTYKEQKDHGNTYQEAKKQKMQLAEMTNKFQIRQKIA